MIEAVIVRIEDVLDMALEWRVKDGLRTGGIHCVVGFGVRENVGVQGGQGTGWSGVGLRRRAVHEHCVDEGGHGNGEKYLSSVPVDSVVGLHSTWSAG